MPDPIFVAEANTPEWLAARRHFLTASDAPKILGVSQYGTPLDVYADKKGLLPPQDDNVAMRMGRRLECVVKDEFCHVTGAEVEVYPCPMFRPPSNEFMSATPDAILITGDLLECKTTTWRTAKRFGEDESDDIPEEWLCQVQQQLFVMGRDVARIAALIDGRTLKTFRVERNDALIELLIAAERKLWERIKNDDPPEPDWNHEHTVDLIRAMHGCTQGKTIRLDDEYQTIWNRQVELAAIEKDAHDRRELLRAQILHRMGEAECAILPDETTISRIYVKGCHVEFDRKSYYMLKARAGGSGQKTGVRRQETGKARSASDP